MKTSRLFPLLLFVFMVVSIPLGVNRATRQVSTSVTKASNSQVLAFFEPANLNAIRNQQITISLKADTGMEIVGGIFGAVEYDPQAMQLINTNAGPFFTNLSANPVNGKVNIKASEKVSGTGTIAAFTFLPLKRGETSVRVSDNFELLDKNNKNNSLSQPPSSLTITIN
jgi:hypothetical protein